MPLHYFGKVYIYALQDPRDMMFRYVGQTTNTNRRYYNHCGRPGMYTGNGGVSNWVSSMYPLRPHLLVLEVIDYGEFGGHDPDYADHRERVFVERCIEAGHPLMNKNLVPKRKRLPR